MKKDIEWLKREIHKELEAWHGVEGGIDGDGINEIMLLINHLDEPETDQHSYKKGFLDGQKDQRQHFKHISKNQDTLSQKWIDKHKYFAEEKIGEDAVVKARDLRNLLVPKQELPVIPKFVAEWIEVAKESGYDLLGVIYDGAYNENVRSWMFEGNKNKRHLNRNKLARAWLDGFTVEEEQKYRVLDGNTTLLGRINGLMLTTVEILEYYPEYAPTFDLTEQEIKDYDPRYWAFAKQVEGDK